MRFYVPYRKTEYETVSQYIGNCNLRLIVFKQILRKNLNNIKINRRIDAICLQPNIQWIVPKEQINLLDIFNMYISNISCYYDNKEKCCYYECGRFIKSRYSITPISDIVRTIEYGGEHLLPLHWLTRSYAEFKEITIAKQNN